YLKCYFFFQEEDGIRDRNVTGVQTCALPIFTRMKISQLEKYSSIFLENLMTQYTHDPEFFDNDAINAQMEIYNELFEKGQSEGKIDSNLTKEDFMFVINIFLEGMKSLSADTLFKRTDLITRFFVNGLKG